jgi:hypothetical protein
MQWETVVNIDRKREAPCIIFRCDCGLRCDLLFVITFLLLMDLSKARIMGIYAAQCMCGLENEYGTDTHLELFAHITRFFGFKVSTQDI